jgi:hypothetical protein
VNTYAKDPDAVLDYQVDWSAWLGVGEEILTSQMIPEDGITVDSDSNTTTTATVWLSGGTAGEAYEVTNRITTTQARTDDRTLRIVVRQR